MHGDAVVGAKQELLKKAAQISGAELSMAQGGVCIATGTRAEVQKAKKLLEMRLERVESERLFQPKQKRQNATGSKNGIEVINVGTFANNLLRHKKKLST